MGRLILHIGTHKTGTTALQKFFDLNRAALAERGIFYPDYDIIGKTGHYSHIAMANAFAGHHGTLTPEDARAFFAAVRARRADHDVTILSAEPFYRHIDLDPAKKPPRDPAAYWPLRRAFIERLAEELAPADVVVVFREQADYAQSLYKEHVKATRYLHDMTRFRRDYWFHFDFLEQARAWEASFPGMTALDYAHLMAGEGIEANFAAAVGLSLPEDLPRAGRQNEGMLDDMVLLKRKLHHTSYPREAIETRLARIDEFIRTQTDFLTVLRRRSLYESAAQRRAFQAGFAEDNAVLAETFLRNVPEGAEPLPRPAPVPGKTVWGEGLHPRMIDFLTVRAVAGLPK